MQALVYSIFIFIPFLINYFGATIIIIFTPPVLSVWVVVLYILIMWFISLIIVAKGWIFGWGGFVIGIIFFISIIFFGMSEAPMYKFLLEESIGVRDTFF